MTTERIEELMKQTAYPESNSVHQAMLQLWNELQQDFNIRTCENCKHYINKTSPDERYIQVGCGLGVTVPLFSTIKTRDFGCNKFETKGK